MAASIYSILLTNTITWDLNITFWQLETELQHNADKAAGLRIQIETTMAAAVEARDCLVHAASLLQP